MDRAAELDHARVVLVAGCSLAEAAVGPVLVVVRDEFTEEPSELAMVPDQGPVQQFAANGAHPSLSERVGLWNARALLRVKQLGVVGWECCGRRRGVRGRRRRRVGV